MIDLVLLIPHTVDEFSRRRLRNRRNLAEAERLGVNWVIMYLFRRVGRGIKFSKEMLMPTYTIYYL